MSIFFRTIKRLFGKIYNFNPALWFPLLVEGLSVEFERIKSFKNDVYSSTVAHEDMPSFAIDDYENKYGILIKTGTDQERINRILERADLNGLPGKDWLERQIQTAGFPLYVIENLPLEQTALKWGTFQWGNAFWGLTDRFIDPNTVLGELIVNSPFTGQGKVYISQFGSFQWGASQFGVPDLTTTTPPPKEYVRTTNQVRYGFYFFLSPDPNGIVLTEPELLELSQSDFNYLKKLIIRSKLMKNWAIAQVKVV